MPQIRFRSLRDFPLVATLAGAACSNSTGATAPVTGQFTVDATTAYTYVSLADPSTPLSVADPETSTTWDIAFYATRVKLNGGAAGPGGVTGYCICQNAAASAAQLQTLTADNQLPGFDSVDATAIPAEAAFTGDAFDPAIFGWYAGTNGAGTVTPNHAWILRVGGGAAAVLGKFRVVSVSGATATTPGSLTFAYALQSASGQPFDTSRTATVDLTAGPVYFSLSAGQVGTSTAWDLKFDDYDIHLNGGVSGPGSDAAVLDVTTPYDSITATYAATAPPQAFRTDAFSGVFAQSPWYRYNITGTDNQIWPTFDVYLVRRGATVYKVQLLSYYAPDGAPRHITVRYAKLTG